MRLSEMWRNALFATFATLMGLLLLFFSQMDFLIPYKRLLVHYYWQGAAVYFILLSINLFAAYMAITRKLLLKDTGRKLAHLEKQLREGSIVHELSDRLSAEE
jgi:hypothetical protein